jgi:hypothetical protein
LLSVDGFNTGLGRGPQAQPSLLRPPPKYLDFGRIPFLAAEDAPIGYGGASEPKALAITQDGDFHWDNDDKDVAAAIAKVAAACKKNNEACVLYAIGDRVVWSPDDEE